MNSKGLNEGHSSEQLLESGANEMWIKRDDLIHPIVSGNKWRKLKYVVQHCLQNSIDHIITYGGAYSNHSIAVACVCSINSIKCTIIIRGEAPEEPNHYALLLRSFKATLVYVSRLDYADKQKVLEQIGYEDKNSIILPEGGAHPMAHKGCGEIISSLTQTYDSIFIASGTGTTAVGILKHLQESNINTHLYIVPVLKNEAEIAELCSAYKNHSVINGAHLGGYAKTNAAVFETIDHLLKTQGLLLDPIYTAKCYIAMQKQIATEGMQNKKILMVHTGGTLGLFSDRMLKSWGGSTGVF
jgi:1-aminocyclopropane-1-carboxylate deaminase